MASNSGVKIVGLINVILGVAALAVGIGGLFSNDGKNSYLIGIGVGLILSALPLICLGNIENSLAEILALLKEQRTEGLTKSPEARKEQSVPAKKSYSGTVTTSTWAQRMNANK